MAVLGSVRRLRWAGFFFLAAVALSASAQLIANESRLEAIYLVKFLRFVNWPAGAMNPNQDIVIGILGTDPFGRMLDDAAAGETVDHHALVVRRLRRLGDAEGCQVLFISDSERTHLRSILARTRGRSVLTVSELDHFSDAGGIVRFVIVNNKLRFEINVAAARAANLSISSKLLELAEIINGPKTPGP